MNENYIKSSVFYAKKQLDNRTLFECAVMLAPIYSEHRMTYSFTVCLNDESNTVEAQSCDFETAMEIFNRIVCDNTHPNELLKTVREFTL